MHQLIAKSMLVIFEIIMEEFCETFLYYTSLGFAGICLCTGPVTAFQSGGGLAFKPLRRLDFLFQLFCCRLTGALEIIVLLHDQLCPNSSGQTYLCFSKTMYATTYMYSAQHLLQKQSRLLKFPSHFTHHPNIESMEVVISERFCDGLKYHITLYIKLCTVHRPTS